LHLNGTTHANLKPGSFEASPAFQHHANSGQPPRLLEWLTLGGVEASCWCTSTTHCRSAWKGILLERHRGLAAVAKLGADTVVGPDLEVPAVSYDACCGPAGVQWTFVSDAVRSFVRGLPAAEGVVMSV